MLTWMPHIVDSGRYDDAQQLQVCQLTGEAVTGQQPG